MSKRLQIRNVSLVIFDAGLSAKEAKQCFVTTEPDCTHYADQQSVHWVQLRFCSITTLFDISLETNKYQNFLTHQGWVSENQSAGFFSQYQSQFHGAPVSIEDMWHGTSIQQSLFNATFCFQQPDKIQLLELSGPYWSAVVASPSGNIYLYMYFSFL